jgi:CBS domain-containing protein
MNELQARDLMCTQTVTVSPKATIFDAAKLILECRVSGLPVTDERDHLVGIITEGDFLRRAEIGTEEGCDDSFFDLEVAQQFLKSHGRYVEDVMTSKVASVVPNTPLIEIARLMHRMKLKCLPVIDDGKIVGVINRADVLGVLISSVEAPRTASAL